MPAIYERNQEIRDLINEPRRKTALLKTFPSWMQLCSSLNVIEDSQSAIDAYSEHEVGSTQRAQYLALYGLLQALFLQQDAIFNMCESLEIPKKLENYPRLKEIREIRHISAGHPTKKDKPRTEQPSYHFISQATLNTEGFQLYSVYADGKSQFKTISIPDLIADQMQYVEEIQKSVVTELRRRDSLHKEKFRMEKLAAIFPQTMSYHLEKIFDSIDRIELAPLGEVNLEYVVKKLQEFREALTRREIELKTYPGVEYLYEELQYPLEKLREFFSMLENKQRPGIDRQTARIFTFFLQKRLEELQQAAREIDEEYSS